MPATKVGHGDMAHGGHSSATVALSGAMPWHSPPGVEVCGWSKPDSIRLLSRDDLGTELRRSESRSPKLLISGTSGPDADTS